MKTIEDEIKSRIFAFDLDKIDAARCESDFRAGIQFAQRWIPVEEELPPLNKLLQVKGIADKKAIEYDFAFFEFKKGLCNSHLIRATHWRPIELK